MEESREILGMVLCAAQLDTDVTGLIGLVVLAGICAAVVKKLQE